MARSKTNTLSSTQPRLLSHLSLKKEKNPFPPSPLTLKDLLLWSPPVFSLSCCVSSFFSLCCCTCWLITNLMSSCNDMRGSVAQITQLNSAQYYIPAQRLTCHASSSWDSATLCLMVLRSCWVSVSFSCRTVASSLSKELEFNYIILKTVTSVRYRLSMLLWILPVAWFIRTISKYLDFLP